MALKKKTVKDKRYLRYIRDLNWCCVCGDRPMGVDAHHHSVRGVTQKGMGMKITDYSTIPLCRIHHSEGHSKGWKAIEQKYGVDLVGVMIGCLTFWLNSNPENEDAQNHLDKLTEVSSEV